MKCLNNYTKEIEEINFSNFSGDGRDYNHNANTFE